MDTKIRENVDNGITLSQWGKVIIDRKLRSNKPGTASWYAGAIRSITKLNGGKDLRLNEFTVTLLTNFQIEHKAKSTSKNGISSYLRAVRALYYSAIKEDQFYPKKNPFQHFKIPTSRRTKKKAISKMDFIKIREYTTKKDLQSGMQRIMHL
ncbi:phage integrase SAM-like domain-containing protein [Arenibacter palladensis]|uniref:phage integrase SAM-like domain-containing protein n=1 Tax=Arenibacter palladensis TaxID=237373 RepID=UPI002FD63CE0